jgi:hypothetical protein
MKGAGTKQEIVEDPDAWSHEEPPVCCATQPEGMLVWALNALQFAIRPAARMSPSLRTAQAFHASLI